MIGGNNKPAKSCNFKKVKKPTTVPHILGDYSSFTGGLSSEISYSERFTVAGGPTC